MLKRLPEDRVVLVSLPPEALRFVRDANAGMDGAMDGASLKQTKPPKKPKKAQEAAAQLEEAAAAAAVSAHRRASTLEAWSSLSLCVLKGMRC